ncbi:MAG: 2-5 ligase [Bacteroidetes bacterium]|nr:2-5 ligase [Bacteroidota bacterium]
MSISMKYGRTYHYPFSPGTTSDDRISHDYWTAISAIGNLVHTEKLDGENNCLSKLGVFARSHAAPTISAWSQKIREYWQSVKNDLGDLEIFGENLYAIHSIEYRRIEDYFFVFGIRLHDRWLSWEETKFYAGTLDLPTVPEIQLFSMLADRKSFEAGVLDLVKAESAFGSVDTVTGKVCSMEGIVTRNASDYAIADFSKNVFKYVRKGHVKTDVHWIRNWKRAKLKWERGDSGYVDLS